MGSCLENAQLLDVIYPITEYRDITKIEDYAEYFASIDPDEDVVICGGDGTLSRFANDTKHLSIKNPLFYFACGNGNDFVRDLGLSKNADPNFRINSYLRPLPSVSVKGESFLFLNNVGFGIDGWCCAEGERLRRDIKSSEGEKGVNYAAIAVKGLFKGYEPRNATVTVDGVSLYFKNVWLAPTMHGRYYGGGMMAAPEQDRLAPDRKLSLMLMHGAGRLKTLCSFPSIFKGHHIRHKKYVTILQGHDIKVEFDRPSSLQIDGEVIEDVKSYEAVSARIITEKELTSPWARTLWENFSKRKRCLPFQIY